MTSGTRMVLIRTPSVPVCHMSIDLRTSLCAGTGDAGGPTDSTTLPTAPTTGGSSEFL